MNCQARNSFGLPCGAPAQNESAFCFSHDPALATKRRDAQSRGGRARAHSVAALPVPELDLSDPTKIPAMLTNIANLLRIGKLDAKRAHAIGHLADCALKAYKIGEAKLQLDRVEQLLEAHRNRRADSADPDSMLQFAADEPTGLPQLRNQPNPNTATADGNGFDDHKTERK